MRLARTIAAVTIGCVNAASAGEFIVAGGEPVPRQFIVVLDHDPGEYLGTLRTEISAYLTRHGVAVTMVWNSAINGFVVSDASDITAREIAGLPGVAFVEPDIRGHADSIQSNAPAGLDLIDQRTLQYNDAYIYNYTAPNVHAYILDSGVRVTHTDFGGRATNDVDFTNEAQTGDLLSGEGGHGTGVASVIGGSIHGVAKQIHLHSVRVISLDASTLASRVISGLNWVKQHGIKPAVVNMSLQLSGGSAAVDDAVKGVVSSGIFVSAAAGNIYGWSITWSDSFSDACAISPARASTAFTVAAPAGYSYRGSCVNIFAPSSVPVASSSTDSATKVGIGTSFSSPHAAGAAALILQQFPNSTPETIRWELTARSTRNVVAGFFDGWSFASLYGSPNMWLYALPLGQTNNPSTPLALWKDPCLKASDVLDLTGGAANNSNSATYYEVQRAANAGYSPLGDVTYKDGTASTVHMALSGTMPFIRARACNSLGCSAFKSASTSICSPHL